MHCQQVVEFGARWKAGMTVPFAMGHEIVGEAHNALMDLKDGKVKGRVVLTP